MTTAVRVISLKDSVRRPAFHRPSQDLGLDWGFMDASTGLIDGIQFDPKLSLKHQGRRLVPAEVGCYCSHVNAWRELLANPALSQMIVLEDDVYADWTFFAQISGVDWSDIGIDYLKLLVKYPAKFRTVKWCYPFKDRHIVQYTSLALGAGAYLITRKAAERFERLFRTISRPIDIEMDRPWATGIPVTGIIPVSAIELSLPTSIRNRDQSCADRPQTLSYLAGRFIEHSRARSYPLFGPTVKIKDGAHAP